MKECKITFVIFDENHKKIFSGSKVSLSKGVNAISGFANKKIGSVKSKDKYNLFG